MPKAHQKKVGFFFGGGGGGDFFRIWTLRFPQVFLRNRLDFPSYRLKNLRSLGIFSLRWVFVGRNGINPILLALLKEKKRNITSLWFSSKNPHSPEIKHFEPKKTSWIEDDVSFSKKLVTFEVPAVQFCVEIETHPTWPPSVLVVASTYARHVVVVSNPNLPRLHRKSTRRDHDG